MRNLAIIPARSGSKGLRDKNIKLLCGKPLMAYAIEAAKSSNCFDTVMVSTDSEKYADLARQYGAEVPFLRSAAMSSDTASTWDAMEEVIDKYEEQGQHFDSFTVLQATSPLRTATDIRQAFQIFEQKKASAVVSVCEMEHSPLLSNTLPEDGSLDGFIDRNNNTRRQDMKPYYRLNGAIYIVDVKGFRKDRFLYRRGAYAYVMDAKHSVDIDTAEDFEYAEWLMRAKARN